MSSSALEEGNFLNLISLFLCFLNYVSNKCRIMIVYCTSRCIHIIFILNFIFNFFCFKLFYSFISFTFKFIFQIILLFHLFHFQIYFSEWISFNLNLFTRSERSCACAESSSLDAALSSAVAVFPSTTVAICSTD